MSSEETNSLFDELNAALTDVTPKLVEFTDIISQPNLSLVVASRINLETKSLVARLHMTKFCAENVLSVAASITPEQHAQLVAKAANIDRMRDHIVKVCEDVEIVNGVNVDVFGSRLRATYPAKLP